MRIVWITKNVYKAIARVAVLSVKIIFGVLLRNIVKWIKKRDRDELINFIGCGVSIFLIIAIPVVFALMGRYPG